jgi:hypothetical protein
MKETEAKKKFAPFIRFIASVEKTRITDRIIQIRPNQIGTKTVRTFIGHLDTIL